jgi:hypothetical protein
MFNTVPPPRRTVGAFGTVLLMLASSLTTGAAISLFPTSAYAQDHEGSDGGTGKKGPQYKGGGTAGAGGEAGQGPQAGGGGEDSDSDGRGPQYGQPSGSQGGKPVWAQEGIPEVELGRLSVARSPDRVLDRALAEVVANFDSTTMAALYSGTATTFAETVLANWDTITIIDSPLENLALLRELWTTQSTSLPGVTPTNIIELSAIFIGTASDKTIPVTVDTVTALATIFGVSLATVETIADKAEEVRLAIYTAHG